MIATSSCPDLAHSSSFVMTFVQKYLAEAFVVRKFVDKCLLVARVRTR